MGVTVRQKGRGGAWWVFVRHHGQRTSKCVGDRRAAERLARELRRGLVPGDLHLPSVTTAPDATPTFGEYADRYLDCAKLALKHSTWVDYEANVRLHLTPTFGQHRLDQIRRAEVKQLVFALRQRGLKPKSARKIVGTLSSILSEAVDDGLIAVNPALQLRKVYRSPEFRDGAAAKQADPLARDEVAHVLQTAQSHAVKRGQQVVHPFRSWYPFLLLLARTGLRLGEAVALKWGDVDWRGGFITVQRSYVRRRLTTVKNKKPRRVDLSTHLRTTLRTIYLQRDENVVAIDATVQASLDAQRAAALDQWIFPDQAGGILDSDNFRHRVWGPLLNASGLRHVRIHDLRHTYASLLLAAGKELHYIQEQLGHHSPAFTLATYGHLLPRDRRGEVDCLDDVTAGPPSQASAAAIASPGEDRSDALSGRCRLLR